MVVRTRRKTERRGRDYDRADGCIGYSSQQFYFRKFVHRFPFPYGLWIYNSFVNRQRDWEVHFKNWRPKPVLISTVNPDIRAKVGTNLLHDYGF